MSVWNGDLASFGVRVRATGRKLYIVQSRGSAGLKRVTLGPVGHATIEERRREATAGIDRIKRGEEPKLPAPPARAYHRRSCRTLPRNPCRGPVQADNNQELPIGPPASHPRGFWRDGPEGRGAGRRHGASPQAARHPLHGKPGHLDPVQDIRPGRELEDGAARPQPVPACPLLPREIPRLPPDIDTKSVQLFTPCSCVLCTNRLVVVGTAAFRRATRGRVPGPCGASTALE